MALDLSILRDLSAATTEISIIGAAVLGALGFTYRKVRKIYHQVVPNGGSSLADTINDIRENQQIAQKRGQILWEHQRQGYYECDAETGECEFANEYLLNIFGMSWDEFKGFGWLAAIESQAERSRIHRSWIAAVKDEIPYQEEYTVNVNGARTKVRTKAWACRDLKTGKALKMFGTLEVVK